MSINIKVKSMFILLLLMFNTGLIQAQLDTSQTQLDKQFLLDLLDLTDNRYRSIGIVSKQKNREFLKSKIEEIGFDDQVLFKDNSIYLNLREQLDLLMQQQKSNSSSVVQINKEVVTSDAKPLGACSGVTIEATAEALTDKLIADLALGSAEFGCYEVILGESAALTCVALQIIDELLVAEYEFDNFCLKDGHYAENTALFETVNSIGEHLNEFIDETTLSDRATQVTVDDIQDGIDSSNDSLNTYLPVLDSNLNTVLDDLTTANNQLLDIGSQADSLLFRTQINQIEIETIEVTTSDIQQRTEEIRDDTQLLILNVESIQRQLQNLNEQSQAKISTLNNNKIEFTILKSANKAPISYQLPSSQNGILEQVRELLITKISSISTLGGKVTSALSLLATGDGYYNAGQYKSAYSNYSSAYQALMEVSF